MRVLRGSLPPLMMLVGACVGAAAEYEALGDRAYAEQRFGDALVEYRLALVRLAPNPGLRAKAALAALRAGDLVSATTEYVAMATEGSERWREEAADGLARVADQAIGTGDQAALAAALDGLQQVAPGRALGSFARHMAGALGTVGRSAEALSVITYAAAAAPDARLQDSLMFEYGVVLRRLGRCEEAIATFESLLRRQRAASIVVPARSQLALCALSLGRQALDRGEPSVAAEWFEKAARGGGDSPTARVAYVGLGDVRFAQGDLLGAIQAYERARAGASPRDSVWAIVAERLNRLGRVGTDIP